MNQPTIFDIEYQPPKQKIWKILMKKIIYTAVIFIIGWSLEIENTFLLLATAIILTISIPVAVEFIKIRRKYG
jgi:hypothetical protein